MWVAVKVGDAEMAAVAELEAPRLGAFRPEEALGARQVAIHRPL